MSKQYRRCVSTCLCFITSDTHNLLYVRSAFEEAVCVHCESFKTIKLGSYLALFLREESQEAAHGCRVC